jgi:hypothetical protein
MYPFLNPERFPIPDRSTRCYSWHWVPQQNSLMTHTKWTVKIWKKSGTDEMDGNHDDASCANFGETIEMSKGQGRWEKYRALRTKWDYLHAREQSRHWHSRPEMCIARARPCQHRNTESANCELSQTTAGGWTKAIQSDYGMHSLAAPAIQGFAIGTYLSSVKLISSFHERIPEKTDSCILVKDW